MFAFSIGDKVSISFGVQPAEETARLKAASGSRVEQLQHQSVAETGTILEQRSSAEGIFYLVNVDSAKLPKGRQRNIPEADLTLV